MLEAGNVRKDELTLEFQLERYSSRAERVRTSTRYQNRERRKPFKVRMSFMRKRVVPWSGYKAFSPLYLAEGKYIWVKRLFCMQKNLNI